MRSDEDCGLDTPGERFHNACTGDEGDEYSSVPAQRVRYGESGREDRRRRSLLSPDPKPEYEPEVGAGGLADR